MLRLRAKRYKLFVGSAKHYCRPSSIWLEKKRLRLLESLSQLKQRYASFEVISKLSELCEHSLCLIEKLTRNVRMNHQTKRLLPCRFLLLPY